MQQIQIASRVDLVCPICHVPGECEAHCVEAWQQGHRKDHLRNLLAPYPQIAPGLLQTLLEHHATPEQVFAGCTLVAWDDEVPATFLPLFNGTALVHTQQPLRWFALFHREGPALLERYEQRVRGQLMRSYKMREMIQTLKEEEPQRFEPPPSTSRNKPVQPTLDSAPEALVSKLGPAAANEAYQDDLSWTEDLIRTLT